MGKEEIARNEQNSRHNKERILDRCFVIIHGKYEFTKIVGNNDYASVLQ